MEIVDYAMPCMMAENALKSVHNSMLDHKYDEALVQCNEAIKQINETVLAIKHEQKNQR